MYGKRKLHKIKLADLQLYFEQNVFYFDGYDDAEDYHEVLERQYDEQVTDFLRRIGAMVNVEKFSAISDDEMVYVRKVPPGVMPVKKQRRE